MNLKKLFLMLTVLAFFATTAFAQNTIYVDVTNGSDTYSGANATNNPAGTGPKATFAAARALVTNGGTIIIKAGSYNEAFDLSTSLITATTTYNIKLEQLNSNNNIDFTNAGAAVINKTGLTVNISQTTGTEKILTSGTTTVNFTAGSVDLGASSAWVLAAGTTLNFTGTSGLTNAAPTKTTNVSLNYTGGSSFNAGPESNYGSFGSGTITVGKTAGTTVTFPNAITALGGIGVSAGNATFSQAVTVAAGAADVVNSGTGTLTFDGALSLGITDGTADANLASLQNTSSGSIIVNSTTAWTTPSTALAADRDFAGEYAISNASTGSLLLNGAITLNPSVNTGGNHYIFEARNASTGTLTLGAVSAPSSGTNSKYGQLRLTGTATAGTINIAGGTYRLITVLATHTLNVNGATTLIDDLVTPTDGILTNAGTINLTGNLTLSGTDADGSTSVPHATNGGTITGTGKVIASAPTGEVYTFNGGALGNVEVNSVGTVNFITNAFTASTMDLTAGTVGLNIGGTIANMNVTGATVTVATTIVQTLTNFTQSGGSFTLTAGATTTLDVNGDFNRTNGTFATGAATLVSFTGSGAQSVNGGPLFQVTNLTFTNAGGTIGVANSIRATGTVTISTATVLEMGTLNLILNGGTNGIINNGTYSATGGGGVVLGGANTVTGGAAGAGYTMEGTGTYSYVTVDVGAANTADVQNTLTGVKWNGVLTLRSGTLDVATVGVDFGPTGTSASIVRYPEDSPGITTTGGTFNGSSVSYDLTYKGALTGDKTVGSELTGTPANVKSWSVETTGNFHNDLPNAGLNFGGTLSIANTAKVRIPTNVAAGTFQLSGANKTHSILGEIVVPDPEDKVLVSGATVVLNGGTATADVAKVGNIEISSTNATLKDFKNFSGTFKTLAGSVVSLGMGTTAANQKISGHLTVGGTSLTLTTNVEAEKSVTHSAGSLNIAAYDLLSSRATAAAAGYALSVANPTVVTVAGHGLTTGETVVIAGDAAADGTYQVTVTGANTFTVPFDNSGNAADNGGVLTAVGNYTQTGGTNASGGGYLVLDGADQQLTLASSLPNLMVLSDATLGASATISGILQVGTDDATLAPTLTLGANNLTVSGGTILLTGEGTNTNVILSDNATTNGGNLIVTGTTLTLDGQNATIEELTLNSDGELTIASVPAATQRTLTISDEFTQTKGNLNTERHIVKLTGDATNNLAYTQAAGSVLSTTVGNNTGWFELAPTAAASLASANVTIDNLKISAAVTNSTITKIVTVAKQLWLSAGAFDHGTGATATKLTLADGVLITRAAAGSLTRVPTFGANVDITYSGGATATGNEVPSTATVLRNLTVNGGTITLSDDMTVNGIAKLSASNITNGGNVFTLASGATLEYNGGVLSQTPTVTNYNLVYNSGAGAALATTNTEFISGKVDSLAIKGTAGIVLNANKSVKNFSLNSTAANGIDINGKTLTVTGNMNYTAGTIVDVLTGGSLTFGGTTVQTIAVPAAGWVMPAGVNLTLNNAAGFNLSGGNLRNQGTIFFINGVMSTGDNRVILNQTGTGQGFDRSGVVSPNVSHIMGNVAQNITAGAGTATWPNGRYEFPVGTTTQYRPYIITFTSAYPAINPTTVVVNHVDSSPEGTKNFPLDAGNGLTIGNYPNYYWLVKTVPSSFTSTQLFDVEMHATNIGYPYDSDQNLRIIRRQDGSSESNGWALQGNSTNYANYQVVTGTDTLAVIRTTATLGGIVNEGTRFTAGVPSQGPVFSAPVVTDYILNEGQDSTITISAISREIGTAITSIAKVSGPDFAVYTAVAAGTGTLALTPGYADGTNDYTVVLRATDARGLTSDITIAVTVNNVNRPVEFTAELTDTVTARAGDQFQFQYAATDEDGDALKFFLKATTGDAISNAAAVSATGLLTWVPATADIGKTVMFQVGVTDNIDTVLSAIGTVTIIDNNAPVFTTVLENQTIEFGDSITVTYVATDLDGDVLFYAFDGEHPDGATLNQNTGEFKWKPNFNQTAIYLIKVRVGDGRGGVAKTVAEITVTADPTGVEELGIPTDYALEQNYPNPFNPTTVIRFGIPEQSNVTLKVYNLLGQEVATLLNTVKAAGWHEVNFNAASLSTGLYIYRIEATDFVSIKKMMLVK